jgi:hypothetical protein
MMKDTEPNTEDTTFAELRRKIRDGELLSASVERLVRNLRFSGRLCIVVQNGRILKSGYEESYFSRRLEVRMMP